MMAQIGANIGSAASRLRAGRRDDMRMLLASGTFSRADVLRMLRGQLLGDEPTPPCQQGEGRRYGQLAMKDPTGPVPHPRNQLCCPLMERGQAGDRTVPCAAAYEAAQQWPEAAGQEDLPADIAEFVRNEDAPPCGLLSRLAWEHLGEMLGRTDTSHPPPADDMARGRLRQAEQDLLRAAEQRSGSPVSVLRVLVDSGRMDVKELQDMVEYRAFVTDPQWLPCRDDERRTEFTMEAWLEDFGNTSPLSCIRCPLQVRALLGDATVPCVVAQQQRQDMALVREAREAHPEGLERREIVEYWTDPAHRPGQQEDIVMKLGVIPCYALGALLQSGLLELLDRLATDVKGWEEDCKIRGIALEDAEQGPPEQTVWEG